MTLTSPTDRNRLEASATDLLVEEVNNIASSLTAVRFQYPLDSSLQRANKWHRLIWKVELVEIYQKSFHWYLKKAAM